MEKTHVKKLTDGSPFRLLVGFMIPLLMGLLFQQFYSMVDTVIVGKLLGVDALAGVGSTGAINFLVLGFCMGICTGFSIPVAQKFGQQDLEGLRRIVGNIIWLGLAFATVITVTVSLLCRHILEWMNTPAETFSYAYTYILIVFLGIPAAMLYNLLSGIIRSLGDSHTPLYFLIFSRLLNVVLDLYFILKVGMGVAGAGVATVASQLVSGILCLIYMVRGYPVLRLTADDMKLRRKESLELLGMGIPMGLQYSITAIGSTMLQTSVNSLGSVAMASTTTGGRIIGFLACPMDAIGSAAATFAGQNVGAGKLRRIHEGTRASFLMGIIYSALACVAVFLFGEQIIMIFLDPGEAQAAEIIRESQNFLQINVLFFAALLCVNLFRFTIQGMGFSHYAMFAGVMELIGRGVLAAVLVPRFGFPAVCFANAAAWIMADLFLIPMYFKGLQMLRKKNPAVE